MKLHQMLLAAVAAGAVVAPATADAATKHHPAKHRAAVPAADGALRDEVSALRAEVAALHQQMDAQHTSQANTEAAVSSTQAEVATTQQQVQTLVSTPPVTKAEVHNQIATAIDDDHKKPYFSFKGITITPGGFLEAAYIYRQHNEGADISSSFGGLPFANAKTYSVSEGRFTARQSRVSFLAQGKPDKNVNLAMYGEFDFQGAAQTANSNESNSYNPRIRHLYMTADWNHDGSGLHLLAGQNWSLLTLNTKGITPRNELTPQGIDAQYVPGFIWARQPQVRLTADVLDHHLWFAVSAENPQTTVAGTVPSNITNTITPASGFYAGATSGLVANTISLNGTPDFVGKIAYEGNLAGHALHLEGFALSRTFTAHYNATSTVAGSNENKAGYGFGGGIVAQVIPGWLDVNFQGMGGKGIGRYGTSGLPDVTFDSTGGIHPIKEEMLLAGAMLHATKSLDLYGNAGEEIEHSNRLGTYGIGLVSANDSGCEIEGGTCAGNTRRVRQLTGGFWDRVYNGNFGRMQVGIQYSYTQRQLFYSATTGTAPQTSESMGLFSIRYYPF